MPASEWNNERAIIEKHVAFTRAVNSSLEALKDLSRSFKAVEDKISSFALSSYCDELRKYYTDMKSSFHDLYNKQLEIFKAKRTNEHEAEMIELQLTEKGLRNVKRKLEQESESLSATQKKNKKQSLIQVAQEPVLPSEAEPIAVSYDDDDLSSILPQLVLEIRREGERLHDFYKNGDKLSTTELKHMRLVNIILAICGQ
ncbi:hypothetical protein G6F64_004875 [Rhizopus arrhizus]|uniref:Uncharacterized protein n=1 Tax=Rhizopus oryzae TaxID=64495 RepID=A0A9P7BTT6_RHIOR|nr:hypothetical protein G6F64_004875 [Rhizopus arrhizus]